MPKVSIIVPNYNHQNFLIQRLESIFNQTFIDYEVILLDDASNDGSQDFLSKYKNHKKVTQIILNSENSGSVFKQWTRGIRLSKGDYIWIAESDDYADFKFLEYTIAQFKNNEGLGMVFTDTIKVDSSGKLLGHVSKSKSTLCTLSSNGGIINKSNLSIYLLKKMVIVNVSSILFKKEALLSLDFEILEGFQNTGDVFTYIGIALRYDVLFLHKPLNYMRLHDGNTTKKNKRNGQIYKDKLIMLDYYLEDFSVINNHNQNVVDFIKSILFLSIDFGHINKLKSLLTKMNNMAFFEKKTYRLIKKIIFFYGVFTIKGRPQLVRERFKVILKNYA